MERNCEGKYQPTAIKVMDEIFDRCPISALDAKACEAVAIVEACEGGGFGGGMILPSMLLSESQFYHNVRQIVLHEKWRLSKLRDKKKKS